MLRLNDHSIRPNINVSIVQAISNSKTSSCAYDNNNNSMVVNCCRNVFNLLNNSKIFKSIKMSEKARTLQK